MIHKLFLYDFDNSILLVYNYLIPDFVLEILFVLLMRPKIVSDFYNVDLGEMFDEIDFVIDNSNIDMLDLIIDEIMKVAVARY